MNIHQLLGGAALAATMALGAQAASISVVDGSFETGGVGGFYQTGCGPGCSYNGGVVPGWTVVDNAGQLQPGSSSGNFGLFSYVPDGITVAYSNGGSISQTLVATVQPYLTYTLTVDVGQRFDAPVVIPLESLLIGGVAVTGTGVTPVAGGWSAYTAVYTATAADAGKSLAITLNSPGSQANWDNVTLTAVPEPASWALTLVGLGGLGGALRARRRAAAVAI